MQKNLTIFSPEFPLFWHVLSTRQADLLMHNLCFNKQNNLCNISLLEVSEKLLDLFTFLWDQIRNGMSLKLFCLLN